MKRCFAESHYALYLDKELGREESREIEEHIKECSRCKELVSRMEAENARIRRALETHTAPDIASQVMARLEAPPAPRALPRWRWALTAAATLLVVGFLFFFLLFNSAPTGNVETRVILCTAKVEGQPVQSHIYESKEPDIQFIWLEKDK
ncbi:MAG: hypothetical protein GY940_40400 [bacterium]|nr:hypothetical protein [bacterium]